jgi:hypothetical protein
MKMLVTMYFLFTSLTTTGFGDFHPRSNSERMLSTIMLLIGVSIFSYAMMVFIDILNNYRSINDHIEDGDNLSKFFGMIARFNNGKKIDTKLKNRIEAYFEYKWLHDKNQAIDDEDEKSMLHQLPFEVQNKLYSGFLHKNFLIIFKQFFLFRKMQKQMKLDLCMTTVWSSYYTWNDVIYRDYMIDMLGFLEPVFHE